MCDCINYSLNMQSKSTRAKKIMIVDDEPAIAETLQFILEEEGYSVMTSSDGTVLEKYMNGSTPDLILLDYWLPKKNGDEIAKALKSRKDTQHIPIIMMSASNNIRDIAREAGVNDFIPKPFDCEDIIDKVHKYTN